MFLGRQSQEGSNPNEQKRGVIRIINHPDYNPTTFDNDVSLLELSETMTFTPFIAPVCLAAPESTFHADIETWVTGWGTIGSGGGFPFPQSLNSTSLFSHETSSPPFCFSLVPLPFPKDLMEVEVPIRGNRECNCNYGVGRITDNMVCAGLRNGGKDSCQVIICCTDCLSHVLDLRTILW